MSNLQRRWEATNIGMSFIAATCTLVEVGKYVAEALTPWTMLFTHVVKLTCASAICALDVIVYTQRKEYQSLIGLGLDVALLCVFYLDFTTPGFFWL